MNAKDVSDLRAALKDEFTQQWKLLKAEFSGPGPDLSTVTDQEHAAYMTMRIEQDLKEQAARWILGWNGPDGEFVQSGLAAHLEYVEGGGAELRRYERTMMGVTRG